MGYNYRLKDENGQSYKLNMEFYDLENPVQVGDLLYSNEELLKEENTFFSFGSLVGKYGRKITSSSDIDIVVLVNNQKEIYLKRFYG